MAALLAFAALSVGATALPAAGAGQRHSGTGVDHVVVIYEENHSFDNLYGN
jgi:phospholipase C